MTSIEILRASVHGDKAWRKPQSLAHVKNAASVPIGANELASASVSLPLAFVRDPDPSLVAILSVEAGKNLFVAPNGSWLGGYVPMVFQVFPFRLAATDSGEYALAFDNSSQLMCGGPDGERFFENGIPTQFTQEILKQLLQVRKGLDAASAAAKTLFDMQLVEPWPLRVQREDGETVVNGLYRANETQLNSIEGSTFLELRSSGLLPIIYAQLISMANLGILSRLAKIDKEASVLRREAGLSNASLFEGDNSEEEIDWDAVLKND